MELLVLRLEGILQRWGQRSQWDFRDTATVPTKSGVMGLIACALGYPRRDERILALDNGLCFGVRVERAGQLLLDYHTVTTDQKSMGAATGKYRVGGPTIITPRQYLQDACFTVIVAGESALLERCAQALQDPHWQLYLGAKCCVPSRPIYQEITTAYDSLMVALQQYPRPNRLDGGRIAYIELEDPNGLLVRYDRILQNTQREYGHRNARIVSGGTS